MIPDEYLLVDFPYRPGAQNGLAPGYPRGQVLGIGNMCALSLSVPLPAVERALQALAYDPGSLAGIFPNAITQVGTHMRTVGIDHLCSAAFGSESHQILTEVAQRYRISGFQVGGE